MMNDVTKLPKWAQNRIAVLEADLEAKRREERATAEGKTEVFLLNHQHGNIPLPPHSHVVFELGDEPGESTVTASVRDRGKRRVLDLHASGQSHALVIEPSSTNVAYVSNRDLDR